MHASAIAGGGGAVSLIRMITLGVRAHDFGKLPIEQMAETVAAHGFSSIQLALAKALDGICTDTGSYSPGLARRVRHAFASRGVSIAVLGCYINPIDPDPTSRRQQMERFKEHLRFARDFGCSVVATETGSRNADWSFHPDNTTDATLSELTSQIGELVAVAEKAGVFVCIEGVTRHVVSTPARMKRVLDAVRSPNLQVLFDPVNLLDAKNHATQVAIMDEAFSLFGDRIQIIHAKDFAVDGGALKPALLGEGSLRLDVLLKHLKRKSYIDVLLEETAPATVDRCVQNLKRALG